MAKIEGCFIYLLTLTVAVAFWVFVPVNAQSTAHTQRRLRLRKHIPLDSIRLSDPFILADSATNMYYMTGTGGLLWKSKDLHYWEGPL